MFSGDRGVVVGEAALPRRGEGAGAAAGAEQGELRRQLGRERHAGLRRQQRRQVVDRDDVEPVRGSGRAGSCQLVWVS